MNTLPGISMFSSFADYTRKSALLSTSIDQAYMITIGIIQVLNFRHEMLCKSRVNEGSARQVHDLEMYRSYKKIGNVICL